MEERVLLYSDPQLSPKRVVSIPEDVVRQFTNLSSFLTTSADGKTKVFSLVGSTPTTMQKLAAFIRHKLEHPETTNAERAVEEGRVMNIVFTAWEQSFLDDLDNKQLANLVTCAHNIEVKSLYSMASAQLVIRMGDRPEEELMALLDDA